MKRYEWNPEKDKQLRETRGISFDEIVLHLEVGRFLDIIATPQPDKYPAQRIFVLEIDGYAWLVPFVESEDVVFLKTAMPSRKMTKHYLRERTDETE